MRITMEGEGSQPSQPSQPSHSQRKRKVNFSNREIVMLLEGISAEKFVIMSKFQSTITMKKKKEAWKRIMDSINASGVAVRTIDEISKKWKSLKSEAFSNVHSQSKTGGGPADKPTPYLDLGLDIIGHKSDAAHGIDGMFLFTAHSFCSNTTHFYTCVR